ncbi:carboxypeptidase-like regulatory domain-containing protein [Flavobacterium sp. DG1-102-2]|uniref:carboxypeptidase-like regulatory domain-containing protein n=1 Tax=Flavobacterium sp. DG1-102-2 TaxID=3081663 RepID=UPI00294A7B62|nr:carboxypeptidase-like regulatory domain-containing protein [Flavobacterium sp. DG1-102-2]MDV6169176.1 carboxypeptidase-like regulatory domain-containing protein [Flavobacterium sp. DG1-102-2]
MKLLLNALVLFCSLMSLNAQTFTGTLKDATTGETLPYVNIGVVNKGIGTVSGETGKFTLAVPEGHDKDTLRISMLGYKTKEYIVSDFAKVVNANSEIKMEQHVTQLKEVVVSNRKSGDKLLGNKTESKSVTAAFTSNKLGNEVGTVMKIKGTSALLKTFTASIASDNNPPVKLRLNFYSLKKGMPDQLLINENIIVAVPKSSGKLVVDLTPYNIMVEDDFFASLEWIEDSPGSNRIWFSAALFATPIISRDTSQGAWTKLGIAGVGFTVDTKYWK